MIARKRHVNGRYAIEQLCDACGKPIRGGHCTDDEVCQGGDGPGFLLCSRKACIASYAGKTPDERRAVYQRHETDGRIPRKRPTAERKVLTQGPAKE